MLPQTTNIPCQGWIAGTRNISLPKTVQFESTDHIFWILWTISTLPWKMALIPLYWRWWCWWPLLSMLWINVCSFGKQTLLIHYYHHHTKATHEMSGICCKGLPKRFAHRLILFVWACSNSSTSVIRWPQEHHESVYLMLAMWLHVIIMDIARYYFNTTWEVMWVLLMHCLAIETCLFSVPCAVSYWRYHSERLPSKSSVEGLNHDRFCEKR